MSELIPKLAAPSTVSKRSVGRPIGSKGRAKNLGQTELLERIKRLQALGIVQGTARRVLEALGGDEYWLRLLSQLEAEGSHDKIASIMVFLLQMRDGRPAQQINVTSQSITFNGDEIARARAVVRELQRTSRPLLSADTATIEAVVQSSASQGIDERVTVDSLAISPNTTPKVEAGEGVKMDGDV